MKKNKLTRHHIIPKSRRKKVEVVLIPKENHEAYHALFGNLTPAEIIVFLIQRYWGKDDSAIIKATDMLRAARIGKDFYTDDDKFWKDFYTNL